MGTRRETLERMYAEDLVYESNCYKKCGDAHCCTLERYRPRFRVIEQRGGVSLPLFPGEHDYLREQGWLEKFGPNNHRKITYDFGATSLEVDVLGAVGPVCICSHGGRSISCRLYPLLPVLDRRGLLLSTENLLLTDDLAHLDGMTRICQINAIPQAQLDKLLAICTAVAANPEFLFYLRAFRLVKQHVLGRVKQQLESNKTKRADGPTAFATFEHMLLRRRAIDHEILKPALSLELEAMRTIHGSSLLAPLPAPASD